MLAMPSGENVCLYTNDFDKPEDQRELAHFCLARNRTFKNVFDKREQSKGGSSRRVVCKPYISLFFVHSVAYQLGRQNNGDTADLLRIGITIIVLLFCWSPFAAYRRYYSSFCLKLLHSLIHLFAVKTTQLGNLTCVQRLASLFHRR